jgi:hypothetical protein
MRESGRKLDPLYEKKETSTSELAVSVFLCAAVLINLTAGAPH